MKPRSISTWPSLRVPPRDCAHLAGTGAFFCGAGGLGFTLSSPGLPGLAACGLAPGAGGLAPGTGGLAPGAAGLMFVTGFSPGLPAGVAGFFGGTGSLGVAMIDGSRMLGRGDVLLLEVI